MKLSDHDLRQLSDEKLRALPDDVVRGLSIKLFYEIACPGGHLTQAAPQLHESGAAALPVEDELADAVQNSGLLHADETTWKEGKTLLWLWVFCNA